MAELEGALYTRVRTQYDGLDDKTKGEVKVQEMYMDKLENLLSLLTTEEKGRSAGGLRRMLLEG